MLLVGCGGDDSEPRSADTMPATTELTIYFLLNGKVWPVRRLVGYTELVERAALDELVAGPTDQELEDFGFFALSNEPFQTMHAFSKNLFTSRVELRGLVVEGNVVRIEVPDGFREDGVAQVVFTLTQFPGITAVDVVMDGAARRLRRDDYERFTPSVLVESPLAHERVTSPINVVGTANTFEANVNLELKDAKGRILVGGLRHATSRTGTRRTFEFQVPYEIAEEKDATLVVFERSVKDGSRTNVIEIPLRLTT